MKFGIETEFIDLVGIGDKQDRLGIRKHSIESDLRPLSNVIGDFDLIDGHSLKQILKALQQINWIDSVHRATLTCVWRQRRDKPVWVLILQSIDEMVLRSDRPFGTRL